MSIVFQQELEPSLMDLGYSKERAHSLSLRCCATFCYHKGCSELGIKLPPIEKFIYNVYQNGMPGAHELGVHHGEMATFINKLDAKASIIILDPLRVHGPPKKFKEIGMYSGKESLRFFTKKRRKLNKRPSITNSVRQILNFGGIPIVGAIQKLSNGYIGSASKEGEIPTHNFLVLSYDKKRKLFTIFDPDKRAFDDLKRLRPEEMKPIISQPGYYTVPPDFLEHSGTKIYAEGTDNERKGGIVIGIFKS
jgi:hypothetical protein